jgi:hypothetical protein
MLFHRKKFWGDEIVFPDDAIMFVTLSIVERLLKVTAFFSVVPVLLLL